MALRPLPPRVTAADESPPKAAPAHAKPARHLRVLPAPNCEPPFDDELPPERRTAAGPGQQALPLQLLLPSGLPARPVPPPWTLLPAARQPYAAGDFDDEGPEQTARAALPDPRMWAARLGQAVVEVCSGGRPVSQLLRWTSPAVYTDLAARYGPMARRRAAEHRTTAVRTRFEQVRSVHVCEPADGVAEVSLVVGGGERPRAVALRLEGLNGRWVCTRLEFV